MLDADRLRTLLGCALGFALASACKPSVDDTGCDDDSACDRGEVCDLTLSECVPADLDTSATESPAPPAFMAKPVPFFRGNVCTVHDVQAGARIPIRLDPCFHPCLSSNSFRHKHYYSCLGTRCEAWATMYVDADATACPADAFGKFDEALCVYDKAVDLGITVTVQDEPVQGTLYLEVPFLSNADMTEVAPSFDDTELLRSKIEQYPVDPNRKVGMDIQLSAASPAPPASCADGACTCYRVGF